MNLSVRKAQKEDLETLIKLWSTAFSDNQELVRRFEHLWPCQEHAYVAGSPTVESALWDIDCGTLVSISGRLSLKMVYAVATFPAHRGKGLAGALLNTLPAASSSEIRCCTPASDSLRDWYVSSGFIPYFFCDRGVQDLCGKITGTIVPVSAEEYLTGRETFLSGRIHDVPNDKALKWQQAIFDCYGGGYFKISVNGHTAYALVSQDRDCVNISELLCSKGIREAVCQLVIQHFNSVSALWRAPAWGDGVSCDLLTSLPPDTFSASGPRPWLGFIFD